MLCRGRSYAFVSTGHKNLQFSLKLVNMRFDWEICLKNLGCRHEEQNKTRKDYRTSDI